MKQLVIFSLILRSAAGCTGLFTGSPCTATVGTASRSYTTPTACIAAMPTNLVTDGNSYVCSLYNDSQFTAGFTISGHTTNATHTITITAASGQSFQDNANVRTNALTYNQANGVGFLTSVSYGYVVQGSDTYVTISRLQFKNTASPGEILYLSGANLVVANNLFDAAGTATSNGVIQLAGIAFNNVIIDRTTSGGYGILLSYAASTVEANTIVCPSDITCGSLIGVNGQGAYAYTIQSNAIFGAPTVIGSTGTYSGGYNATNLASGFPGSNNVYNVTWNAAAPFTGGASTALDLRAISGTGLIGAGYLDSTNAPLDISGYGRPATPSIGAWQVVWTAAWTLVQYPSAGCTSSGTTTSLTCTLTLTQNTSAGDLLVMLSVSDNTQNHSATYSAASGDGTWTHCPSAAETISKSSDVVNTDCAYILSATGGAGSTTFKWTYASTATGDELVEVVLLEFTPSGGRAVYDTDAVLANASCGTSCTGVALSLAGSSDVMVEWSAIPSAALGEQTSISNPFAMSPSPLLQPASTVASGYAWVMSPASGSAPTWTLNSGGLSIAMSAVAFKVSSTTTTVAGRPIFIME